MLWLLWAPVALAAVIIAVDRLRKKMKPNYGLPLVGSPNEQSLSSAIIDGYQKVIMPVFLYFLLNCQLTETRMTVSRHGVRGSKRPPKGHASNEPIPRGYSSTRL